MRIALIISLLTIKVLTFELNVTNHSAKELIYHGERYNANEYPYVVTITIAFPRNTKETCTGTLLNKLLVLTSAHCVYDIDKYFIKVYQGTWVQNKISRNVIYTFIHEDYNPEHNNVFISGDVSVLQINKPFPKIKEYINMGGTPDDFFNENILYCIVIGFGLIDERTMGFEGFQSHVKVKHGKTACRGFNSESIRNTWDQYLCTIPGDNATCIGDNGGPMICDGLLYGICSFAINFYGDREKMCGSKNVQVVHLFIHYYRKWIDDVVELVMGNTVPTTEEPDYTTEKSNREKTKTKTKKKSAGESIKPHHTLFTIPALLFYNIVL